MPFNQFAFPGEAKETLSASLSTLSDENTSVRRDRRGSKVPCCAQFTSQSRALQQESEAHLRAFADRISGAISQAIASTPCHQFDAELCRREQELSDFVNNGPMGLHWVGADGHILWANQAELSLLGYARADYIGHDIREFHVDPEVIADILQRLAANETLHDYEARLRCKDGSIKHVLIDSNVFWRDGEFVHTRCFTRDISDRRRAEIALQQAKEELEIRVQERTAQLRAANEQLQREIVERQRTEATLRESEAQYRRIIETTSEGVWIIDADNQTVFANHRMAQILGYELDEILNQPVLTFVPEESRAIAAVSILHCRRGRRETCDLQLCCKDGSHLWVMVSANPIFDRQQQYIGALGMFTDITQRKQVELEIQQSEQKYRNLFDNSLVGMFRTALADGMVMDANAAILKMFGYESYAGIKAADLYVNPADRETVKQRLLQQGFVENFAVQMRRKDGASFWVSYSAKLYPKSGYLEGVAIDITQRKQVEETIRYQADHDLLTQLPNRKQFNEQLPQLLAKARENNHLLAVIFVDLDRFKTINDTLGHAVGDRLLQVVAQRLQNCLRDEDLVSRWGGDEFTILIPHLHHPQEVYAIAQRLLDTLKPTFELERVCKSCRDTTLHISTSLGIAIYPRDGEDAQTLLSNADVALYAAKQQGRNNYQLYTTAMNSQACELLGLENDLHHALGRDELAIYYQPQVNLNTGEVTGMEALLRWQHPRLGLISPAKFIPLAEETGLILPMGEWVLQRACEQNRAWQDAGIGPLRVSVNLSPRQFEQPSLLDFIAQTLQESRLAPELLELEITETTAMQDAALTRGILSQLEHLGVNIAIDDFGTGYSSLGYLNQFPLHALKIDKSFVRHLDTDSRNAAIVQAILTLGKGFALRVIAEGVETEAEKDCLRHFQCEEMQGYLSSHPLSAKEATQLLQNWQLGISEQ